MIPPYNPPMSDDERTRLADYVIDAHQHYNAPPLPFHGIEHTDMVLTARTTWLQTEPDQPATPTQYGVVDTETALRALADKAAATPNPLRELITELTRFADRLDQQGVMPLGIHTCTAHQQTLGMYHSNGGHIAKVVATVRGVRREWIEQHRTRVEAPSGELSPRECACYGWAIADARNADWWGKEHHPKCDGTGQHKTETP